MALTGGTLHTGNHAALPSMGKYMEWRALWHEAAHWLMIGRRPDAEALFERLLSVRSDLGLLAEEFDPRAGRLCGNYPQAFSHIGLINAAFNLTRAAKPTEQRSEQLTPAHDGQ